MILISYYIILHYLVTMHCISFRLSSVPVLPGGAAQHDNAACATYCMRPHYTPLNKYYDLSVLASDLDHITLARNAHKC